MKRRQAIAIALLGCLILVWTDGHSSEYSRLSANEPRTAAASDARNKNEQEEHWWQSAIAIFTLGLVFVGAAQLVLFYVQLKLIREGLAGTKEAADAAQGAARAAEKQARIAETALLSVEIPYLYPFIRRHGFIINPSKLTHQLGVTGFDFGNDFIEYYFKNFGRTPAEITEVQSILLPSMGVPHRYAITDQNLNPLSGHIVAADNGESQNFPYAFSKGMFETYSQGKVNPDLYVFWFMGFVRYNDVFDNEYIRGFCLAYSPMTNSFYPVGGDGYNYRRKTKSPG
jgi:hypothetical protein